MGIRIVMALAMGLGAMYMVHLLAMDYNKIRQPVKAKRDLENIYIKHDNNQYQGIDLIIDWENILKKDPFNCLLLLICEVISIDELDNREANEIKELIEFSLINTLPPKEIIMAYENGIKFKNNSKQCGNEYPLCLFNYKIMLKMLKWFSK